MYALVCNITVDYLLELVYLGGWDLVGITESGSWSVNSDFFLKEKLIGSPALFYFGSTIDYHNSNKMIMEVSLLAATPTVCNIQYKKCMSPRR